MKSLRFISIVGFGLLTACTTLTGPDKPPPLPLLPPGGLGQNLQISQRVNVTFDGEAQTFLAAWVIDSEKLDFVGLTPSGQRLLTLGYDGRDFSEHYSPMLDNPIPGREVLSHLQLAHWPPARIQPHLNGTDWRLSVEDGERHLYFKGNLILSIAASYTDGDHELPAVIRIRSHVAPYRLEVETLQVVEK